MGKMRAWYDEAWYDAVKGSFLSFFLNMIPFFRRILRFCALPYVYFFLIDWEECKETRMNVISDLVYIFFHLKYFPDNYSACRLWEKERNEWNYYYGSNYDPYQRKKLRIQVQPQKYSAFYENKHACYQLCKAADLPLPNQYASVEVDDNYENIITSVFEKIKDEKVVIKPTSGKGGAGILLAFKQNGHIFLKSKKGTIPIEKNKINFPFVIQEYVHQHESLEQISSSVNTIRLVTLLKRDKKVITIGAYMRFGVDEFFTDNVSMGGVAVQIDVENGRLKSEALDKKGRRFKMHKTSKFKFEGFCVPFWEDVLIIGEKAQRMLSYHRLLGHDIAITNNGPVIIEINSSYDNVGLEQKCGPVLKNKEVLRAYGDYDLLINKKQLELYHEIAEFPCPQ